MLRHGSFRHAVTVIAASVLAGGTAMAVAPPAGATGAASLGGAGSAHLKAGVLTRSGQTRPTFTSSGSATGASAAGFSMPHHVLGADTRTSASPSGTGSDFAIPSVTCPGTGCDGIGYASPRTTTTNRYALSAIQNGKLYKEDVEPPDQMMCAGNGYVVEGINIGEMQVYNTSLKAVSGVVTLDDLLGLPTMGSSGWSSGGDPTCLYDPNNGGHWFVEEIVSTNSEASGGPFTGCFTGAVLDSCREGLAVSATNDPMGAWNIYFVDPNQMSPGDPGAGYLLNDYSKIGTTRDALMMFYDEFNLNASLVPSCPAFDCEFFNGAQELAFQKSALELGASTVNLVHENMGTDPAIQPGTLSGIQTPQDESCYTGAGAGIYCWAQVIPAQTTSGEFDNNQGGTGYMVATTDFVGWTFGFGSTGSNTVGIFSWTGLSNLNSSGCSTCGKIAFGGTVYPWEVYSNDGAACPASAGNPCGLAPQKAGTLDLGTYCTRLKLAHGGPCAEQGLATNDAGITQVSYGGGQLWFATSTLISEQFSTGPEIHTGALYGVFTSGSTTAALSMTSEGYVAAAHEDILFPTMAANSSSTGSVLMSFTLSGDGGPTGADAGGFYPSTAYGLLTSSSSGLTGSTIEIAAIGEAPQDGFTEYLGLPGATRPRWGDYGAAVFIPGSGFFFAGEYIQYPNCSPKYFIKVDPTCGGTRDPFANFGTSLTRVS
jgi:hypothetical protein